MSSPLFKLTYKDTTVFEVMDMKPLVHLFTFGNIMMFFVWVWCGVTFCYSSYALLSTFISNGYYISWNNLSFYGAFLLTSTLGSPMTFRHIFGRQHSWDWQFAYFSMMALLFIFGWMVLSAFGLV